VGREILIFIVSFEDLTAIGMMFTVLWGVTPCSLVDLYRRFIGRCCHLPVTINRGLLFRAEDEIIFIYVPEMELGDTRTCLQLYTASRYGKHNPEGELIKLV
jgi:hypothetical protein